MKKIVVVLWSILLFCSETDADTYLKQIQTIPSTGKTVERTLWIGKDAVREQSPNLTKITRFEDNVMYTLVAGKKKAITLSLDTAAKMLKESGRMTLSVTPTSETKKIGKWQAKKYIQKMTSPFANSEAEVWVTQDIVMDKATLPQLNQRLFLATPAGSVMPPGIITAADKTLQAEIAKMQGVPVYSKTTYEIDGKKNLSETKLIDAGEKAPPANTYLPPSDYQLIGLDGKPVSAPLTPNLVNKKSRNTTSEKPKAPAKIVEIRQLSDFPQTKKVGKITHTINSIQVTKVIPANWTIDRFKSIAKPKPAPVGKVWYVVKGTVSNHSDKTKSLNGSGVFLEDETGTKYKADPKMALYQETDSMLVFKRIEPGTTASWMAYFLVNTNAHGLHLKAGDLQFVSKEFATFDLSDDNASIVTAKKEISDATKKQAGSQKVSSNAKPMTAVATGKTSQTPLSMKTAVPLSRVFDKKIGASLMLPTGSQSVREMDRQHDWFFQPKDSAIGYSTILTAMWSATNLEQAVKVATMTGGKQVAEKKAIANGFVVMKKPRGMIQELWVFQNAKGKKLAAKCSGPATALKTLMAICGSLKVE